MSGSGVHGNNRKTTLQPFDLLSIHVLVGCERVMDKSMNTLVHWDLTQDLGMTNNLYGSRNRD